MKPMSVVVVLDRSGSMETIREKTIGGFNEFVHGLKVDAQKTESPTELTLMMFDDGIVDTIFRGRPIAEVSPLTMDSYRPRGSTNLLDAVGEALHGVEWIPKTNSIAVAIMTDGEENSSKRYTIEQIRRKIADADLNGVLISYVGANQDAWKVGAQYGFRAGNTMSFNDLAIQNVFTAQAASFTRFKHADGGVHGLRASEYTGAEISAAVNPNAKI